MAKAILLDLDNTLYAYEPVHQYAIEQVFHYYTNNINGKREREHFNALLTLAKQRVKNTLGNTAASHNRLLYMQTLCELAKVPASQHALTMYNCYWDNFLEKLHLSEKATTFFNQYSDIPICLVSDLTAHIQYRKLAKLGINNAINFIVTSEEAGHEKPHPYMFQLALQKLGASSKEACMIGDSYSKDIAGAMQLGIKSYWLQWENQSNAKLNKDLACWMEYQGHSWKNGEGESTQAVTIINQLTEVDW